MIRRQSVGALAGALLLALAFAAPAAAAPASTVLRTGLPNHTLTPGVFNLAVTQTTIHRTICVSGWTATVRPPTSYTNALKVKQLAIYGYADRVVSDYEEDHFVPLELGGNPASAKNLWPEPHHIKLANGQDVGSYAKDALETHLKSLVCAGRLTLAAARHEIMTNWVYYWRLWKGLPATTPAPAPTPAPTATTGGSSAVKITSLTSPVSPGATATASAHAASGASCSITVEYASGPSSAQGLGPKTAAGSGAVSWSWTVGTRTTPGSWPVTVTCTAAGTTSSATAYLVVT
jgi:hypothetical protein